MSRFFGGYAKRLVTAFAILVLVPALAFAAPVYVRSTIGPPWGENTNELAMNAIFGPGAWTQAFYETAVPAALLNPATNAFIFMEGGDNNANALNAFLTANSAAIASYVSSGGRLFINAAPNEGGNINFGFGVTLNYAGDPTSADIASPLAPGNPIFVGPKVPVTTNYTGDHYAHAFLTGPLTGVVQGNPGQIVFGTLTSGSGLVGLGGMTTTNFHSPNPQAANLRANMIALISGASGDFSVPTLQPISLAVLAGALALLALVAFRMRRGS